MGAVYEAFDLRLRNIVAVKQMTVDGLDADRPLNARPTCSQRCVIRRSRRDRLLQRYERELHRDAGSSMARTWD